MSPHRTGRDRQVHLVLVFRLERSSGNDNEVTVCTQQREIIVSLLTHLAARTGDWDFYIFEDKDVPPTLSNNEEEPTTDSPTLRVHDDLDMYLQQEILLRYGIDIDELGLGMPPPPSRSPPLRRPPRELTEGAETEREEETKPEYQIIPFVSKSSVTINFARRTLEEFMDR